MLVQASTAELQGFEKCHCPIILGYDTPRIRGESTRIRAGLRVHSFGTWLRVFCKPPCVYQLLVPFQLLYIITFYLMSMASQFALNQALFYFFCTSNCWQPPPPNSSLDHQRNLRFVTSYFGTRRCLVYTSKCLYLLNFRWAGNAAVKCNGTGRWMGNGSHG